MLAAVIYFPLSDDGCRATLASPSVDKQKNFKKNTLPWFAHKAKAEGKNRTVVRAPFVTYRGEADPPEAILSQASVVVARPVEMFTFSPNDEEIVTWYKFEVIESLKEGIACQRCPHPPPPPEILPVSEGEFLLVKYGGSLNVDGVQVSMVAPGFPPFSRNKKYLLFLVKSDNGIASLVAGPSGVYTINPNGELEPTNDRPHPLKEVIRQRFRGSVEQLRRQVK
jgi:hypothetical protein